MYISTYPLLYSSNQTPPKQQTKRLVFQGRTDLLLEDLQGEVLEGRMRQILKNATVVAVMASALKLIPPGVTTHVLYLPFYSEQPVVRILTGLTAIRAKRGLEKRRERGLKGTDVSAPLIARENSLSPNRFFGISVPAHGTPDLFIAPAASWGQGKSQINFSLFKARRIKKRPNVKRV